MDLNERDTLFPPWSFRFPLHYGLMSFRDLNQKYRGSLALLDSRFTKVHRQSRSLTRVRAHTHAPVPISPRAWGALELRSSDFSAGFFPRTPIFLKHNNGILLTSSKERNI